MDAVLAQLKTRGMFNVFDRKIVCAECRRRVIVGQRIQLEVDAIVAGSIKSSTRYCQCGVHVVDGLQMVCDECAKHDCHIIDVLS
jgi:hypothetical protein